MQAAPLQELAQLVEPMIILEAEITSLYRIYRRHPVKITGAGATNVRDWLLQVTPLQEPAQLVESTTILEAEITLS